MATVEQVLAAADRAEAVGDIAAAARLRAHAETLKPAATTYDPEKLKAAAGRARAAGDEAAAVRLLAAIPAAPVDEVAAVAVDTMPAAPPRALAGEAGHKFATDFAGFEMFNPELAGRYTPETMPRPGDVVIGSGGGGKSGGARVTVRDWRQSRQPQAQFGDTASALMEGPTSAMKAFGGGLAGGPSPSRDFLAQDPLTQGLPGPVLTGLGALGDIGGAGLSALGAGLSGAVGLATEAVPTHDRQGLGEELIGMSQFAVPELAGASSIPARMAATAPKLTAPAVKAIEKATPTIEGLRAAKSTAYKAVDEAGEMFTPEEMTGLRTKIETELADGNYVEGVDRQTDAVRSIVERKAGKEMSLGQLDKLRQEFYKRLAAAPNEVGIHDAIDAIDEMIAGRTDASGLMQAAREANAKYKKAELLDFAFEKARNQTDATGSGGNILNKYRQAVVSILNNPKQSRWFSADELAGMKSFVRGSKAQNAMRLIGKLSPGGNGLMTAINVLGAGATGGGSVVLSGLAMGAKAISDSAAVRGGAKLIENVSKGAPEVKSPAPLGPRVAPELPPMAVAPLAGQEAANANRNPEYDALLGRYK